MRSGSLIWHDVDMQFDVLTIFPKMISSYANESILKRAQEKKLISITAHDLRSFSTDPHRKVDDRPFGGGAGMVMTFQPIASAVASIKLRVTSKKKPKTRVILFSTRGKKFDDAAAQRLARYDQLIFICGRYEGVDERVADVIADEEISIGDYVLTGGELPALSVIDAVSRKLPGVLGKHESLEEVQGSYKSYTRPEVVEYVTKTRTGKLKKRLLRVPKVLTSGHHERIALWRKHGID